MSVKTEYEALLTKAEELRKDIDDEDRVLNYRKQEHSKLVEKRKQFLKHSSYLAQRLFQDACKKILSKEKEIRDIEKSLEGRRKELENIEKRIRELEEKPSAYIEEQTQIMTEELRKYIDDKELVLGRAITSIMLIHPKMTLVSDRRGSYYIPDGNVFISIESLYIIGTNDFYFKQQLYTETRCEPYDNVVVNETKLFKNYLRLFYKTLRIKIEEAFKEHPNFRVNFTDNMTHFTIELR